MGGGRDARARAQHAQTHLCGNALWGCSRAFWSGRRAVKWLHVSICSPWCLAAGRGALLAVVSTALHHGLKVHSADDSTAPTEELGHQTLKRRQLCVAGCLLEIHALHFSAYEYSHVPALHPVHKPHHEILQLPHTLEKTLFLQPV